MKAIKHHDRYLYLIYRNPWRLGKRAKREVARDAALFSLSLMSDEYLAMLDKQRIKVIGTHDYK